MKIENILISQSGDVKIIDFGLSNTYSHDSLLKTFCGSLYFAAPELLNAYPYCGPEIDVWSFGVVLYVLVCGKVPFDDQSMPALHAKIKRGHVEYPSWLSSDCRDLLTRILVVDPLQRATLADVKNHPWMNKGYDKPPDAMVPFRRPITLPLDPGVISEMTGFEFGTEEKITSDLIAILESPEYINACKAWYKLHGDDTTLAPRTSRGHAHHESLDPKRSRHFSLDFYKRRLSLSDHSPAPPSSTLDPTNAYHPLLSIYYLVSEKQERDRKEMEPYLQEQMLREQQQRQQQQRDQQLQQHREQQRQQLQQQHIQQQIQQQQQDPKFTSPVISAPEPVVVSKTKVTTADHIMPEKFVFGGTPRQQEPVVTARRDSHSSGSNIATNLLRRFSSKRKPKDLPPVTVSPSAPAAASGQPRSYLRHQQHYSQPVNKIVPEVVPDVPVTPSQPKQMQLGRSTSTSQSLSKPTEVSFQEKTNLTRSVTRPKEPSKDFLEVPKPASTTRRYHPSARAKSVGHARGELVAQEMAAHQRESAVARSQQPVAATTTGDIVDELFDSTCDSSDQGQSSVHKASKNSLGAASSQNSTVQEEGTVVGMPSIEFPKQVFLKGFFSVQSTSTKSLAYIRSDVIRVLSKLNIEYKEIKGGFLCLVRPGGGASGGGATGQEDTGYGGTVLSPPQSPVVATSSAAGHEPRGHWRKLSFGSGFLRRSSRHQSESSGNIVVDFSDLSTDSVSGTTTTTTYASGPSHQAGNSDMLGMSGSPNAMTASSKERTPLQFELWIVRVPLLSLHGVQFKKLRGNSWLYKSLASKILAELRL